jgi:hypothetical protein
MELFVIKDTKVKALLVFNEAQSHGDIYGEMEVQFHAFLFL